MASGSAHDRAAPAELEVDVGRQIEDVAAGIEELRGEREAATAAKEDFEAVRATLAALRHRVLDELWGHDEPHREAAWEAFRAAHGVHQTDWEDFLEDLEDCEVDVAWEWRPEWGTPTTSYADLKAIAPRISPTLVRCFFEYVLEIGRSCGVYT